MVEVVCGVDVGFGWRSVGLQVADFVVGIGVLPILCGPAREDHFAADVVAERVGIARHGAAERVVSVEKAVDDRHARRVRDRRDEFPAERVVHYGPDEWHAV